MNTLLGVAVAMTVLGAASGLIGTDGMLADHPSLVQTCASILMVAALLYLLGSGLLALDAYRIDEVYRPTLNDQPPLTDETTEPVVILFCIEQNWRAATLRLNRLSACFCCLRNGLIVVFLLGLLVILSAMLAPDNTSTASTCGIVV